LYVHDEFQFYVLPKYAEKLIQIAKDCIKETGESFNLRVPLEAEGKEGRTWSSTH
jgi:DNA polymerase I-like protein with 3'-5' exonuclease and polymerase domains